jgi:starvation-inducible DNA-binding protein
MEELHTALKKAFATTYAFLVKAENFHWNVTGVNFVQYHKLFGEIYDEVEDELDDFAETLRAQSIYVHASFQHLKEMSAVEDTLEILPAKEMLRVLYIDNVKVHETLLTGYQLAETYRKPDLCAFLSERIEEHRKHGWKLFSSLEP